MFRLVFDQSVNLWHSTSPCKPLIKWVTCPNFLSLYNSNIQATHRSCSVLEVKLGVTTEKKTGWTKTESSSTSNHRNSCTINAFPLCGWLPVVTILSCTCATREHLGIIGKGCLTSGMLFLLSSQQSWKQWRELKELISSSYNHQLASSFLHSKINC